MPHEHPSLVLGITRKSLEATFVHACPHCDAPGLYKDDEHNRQHWPGIVDAKRVGHPVGDICPNCGKPRRENRDLGELTASMPLWIWNTVLAAKWCMLKVMSFKT